MKRLLGLIGTCGLLLATGCTYRIGYMNVISTKNVYAKDVNLQSLPKRENVEAEDIRFLGIGANVSDPLDKALNNANGNVMIDAVIYYKDFFLFGGFKVRGTVVNVGGGVNPSSPAAVSKK